MATLNNQRIIHLLTVAPILFWAADSPKTPLDRRQSGAPASNLRLVETIDSPIQVPAILLTSSNYQHFPISHMPFWEKSNSNAWEWLGMGCNLYHPSLIWAPSFLKLSGSDSMPLHMSTYFGAEAEGLQVPWRLGAGNPSWSWNEHSICEAPQWCECWFISPGNYSYKYHKP